MPRMVDDNDDDGSELAVSKEGNEGGDEGNDEKLKKGPWTAFEDEMLREYVMKHGEGNWNSVQKNSGLARCGKSCRLRWANHLRPNLKKGAFSKEEEEIIVHLHAKLGNKWARMAAQLHGRTDNEIKNFWNTRMKRRQRAGLPLYPPEVQYEANSHNQYFAQPYSSSSLSFSSFLSPSYSQELNKKLSHSSLTNSQQNEPNHSCYTNPHSQFRFTNDNIGFSSNTSLSLSTISSHGQPLFDQYFAANKSCDYYSSTFMAGSLQESLALVQGSNTEVSSSQSPPGSTTPASSNNSGVYCLMGASSVANGCEIASLSPQGNNGLLEDPVAEAQSVSHNDMSKSEDSVLAEKLTCKRKIMAPRESSEEDNTLHVETIMKINDDNTKKKQRIDSSSSQFSTGKKLITEDSLDGMNSTDDDLFTLLNNFPSDMPMPGWYRHGERHSLELESQKDASSGHIDQEFAWTLGTFWSNMPNIC